MIKAVLFDIGGVLFTDPLRNIVKYVSEQTGKNPAMVRNAMRAKWGMYKEARIDAGGFWQAGLDKIGAKMDIEELNEKACNMIKEIDSMLLFAKKLKENRYKLGIISNNTKEWFEYEKSKFRIDEIFDAIVLSCDEQVSKPNERLYRICAEKLNLEPEECVYVDDKESNLEPAEKLGMKTIHFENQNQLKNGLKLLGVET